MFLFWGCPALWSGRSTAQLAGLLGPAALSALWSAAFGGPASAAQPLFLGFSGLGARLRP
nr:hypothetical protein [Saprospira grandis]